MDGNNLESKYQKLATEYSKIRAQASVLKKAVIEEQTKNLSLREKLRQKETSLRRSEQEVDSLGFRNKQLEYRVASLQEDLEKETKLLNSKQSRNKSLNKNNSISSINSNINDEKNLHSTGSNTFFEEFNAKIQENATLTSHLHDKEQDLELYKERCSNLEKLLEKRNTETIELEKRLRNDLDALQTRNSELENKLIEATSMLGSEDALSASGSDNTTPLHTNSGTCTSLVEDRIFNLEKELCHWRTQFEILKMTNSIPSDISSERSYQVINGSSKKSCSLPSSSDKFEIPKEDGKLESKQQKLIKHFNEKIEEMLRSKCIAESKLSSYINEVETLQMHIEILMNEIKCKENELKTTMKTNQYLEDDLATTRLNYDEQISVLTEQVISLSEQLASSK